MLIYSKKCQVLVHSLPRTGLEQEVVWGVVQEMEPRAGWSRPRQPPDSWEGKKSKDTQLQTQGVCVCVHAPRPTQVWTPTCVSRHHVREGY